jgi:dihydrodiol dehydrogenase / D-xylose 1-dehydrogenase (NADP)
MTSAAKATHWGIVGAGKISNDFCLAIGTFPAHEHDIVAVAARRQEDADSFAQKHGIKHAYADYAAIAADANVDVVYIGVLHPRHAELSMLMLSAGKHVVCEKPMAMSASEARRVIDTARANKKLFLEGFWSRFFPAYNQLRTELEQGSIGEVRALSVHFGVKFEESETSRVINKEMGGGVALDIGCYAVQLANLVFNMERPEKIFVHGSLFSTGVDKKFCDVDVQG